MASTGHFGCPGSGSSPGSSAFPPLAHAPSREIGSRTLRRSGLLALAVLALALLARPGPGRGSDHAADRRPGRACGAPPCRSSRASSRSPFDVEILDVVAGRSDHRRARGSSSGSRARRSTRPASGPGFSGSPIYCPDAEGRPANAGAISESVGEYGGKVGLATPIEAILGNPPDAPVRATEQPAATRRARPLGGVLTVSGLSRPLRRRADPGRRAPRPDDHRGARRARCASFPPQVLRPGSAVSIGYSSGDIAIGAVGTVAYVDGDRVWSFGHQLDAAGRRNLLLQDAYVYRVINNPNQAGESGLDLQARRRRRTTSAPSPTTR